MSNRNTQIQMLSSPLSESVSVSLPYAISSVSIFKQSRYSSGKTYSTQCIATLSKQSWFWMLGSVKLQSKHIFYNFATKFTRFTGRYNVDSHSGKKDKSII